MDTRSRTIKRLCEDFCRIPPSRSLVVALDHVESALISRHQETVGRRGPVGHALQGPTAFRLWVGSSRNTELWSISLSSRGIRPFGSVNQMRPFRSMAKSLGVL